MKNEGTLNDGSPLARKREIMAKLRKQIPAVEEALQKTQQRYKRNFDSNVDARNQRVCVGDYVYTTNHQKKNKLQSRTVGPFVLLNADDYSCVIDVNGEEQRVNTDRVSPAPRPSTQDETPHTLLDGLDKPESTSGAGRIPTYSPALCPYRATTRPPCLLPRELDPSQTRYFYPRSMT